MGLEKIHHAPNDFQHYVVAKTSSLHSGRSGMFILLMFREYRSRVQNPSTESGVSGGMRGADAAVPARGQ